MPDSISQMLSDSCSNYSWGQYGSYDSCMDFATRVLAQENPNQDLNAVSPTGVKGLAQGTQKTWGDTMPKSMPYGSDAWADPANQLDFLAILSSRYLNAFGGDTGLAAFSYNSGYPAAQQVHGLMNTMGFQQAVNTVVARIPILADRAAEHTSYPSKIVGQSAASSKSTNQAQSHPNTLSGIDDTKATAAVPVYGQNLSGDQLTNIGQILNPPILIRQGLFNGNTPVPAWYQDPKLLRVDRTTITAGYPCTFQIVYREGKDGKIPGTVNLMASLRSHQRSMRHLVNRSRTRTGMQVDLWGMVPDLITGQASTSLFANQLGVTDFLSLSTVPSQVQTMVTQGYNLLKQEQHPSKAAPPPANLGKLANLSPESCRVAAKDAFMELLATFRNNGLVWFQNANYTGYTTGLSQQATDVWSPVTGSTSFQNAARRNDVMVRGKVIMRFRNTRYSGYFKSLNWNLDAKNPFRWNFTFVFQVEKTMTDVPVVNFQAPQ